MMTADDLKQLFRFQLTVKEDTPPRTELSYETIDGYSRLKKTHALNDFDGLAKLLEGFQFDAYRADDTVVFIKPEVHIVV
jgi:hypothetical protein